MYDEQVREIEKDFSSADLEMDPVVIKDPLICSNYVVLVIELYRKCNVTWQLSS